MSFQALVSLNTYNLRSFTMNHRRTLALLSLLIALPLALSFGACAPPPTEHPVVPHYRFEGALSCAHCDAESLVAPGAELRVLILRNGSEPSEDIIMFEEAYPTSADDAHATRALELQFPNDRLGTARNVWIEAAYVGADGEVLALAKQRFVRPSAMPEINTFELELTAPSSTPSLEERMDDVEQR